MQCRLGDPQRRETAAGGFQFRHCLEHFDEFRKSRLTDENAAAGDLLDEARGREFLQGFADRGARHTEPVGEPVFVQSLAGCENAGQDHVFQIIENAVGAANVHGRHYRLRNCGYKNRIVVYENVDIAAGPPAIFPASRRGKTGWRIWEDDMKITFLAAAAALAATAGTTSATDLRLSHQWAEGDVRHQVAQMVADDVAAADVDLNIQIFPQPDAVQGARAVHAAVAAASST